MAAGGANTSRSEERGTDMVKRTLWALLTVVLVGAAAPATMADRDKGGHGHRGVVIRDYGVSPFLYGGYSYIPLKSATDFLGAALLWDSLHNRATVTYNGRKLGLVVGSTTAYYGGRAVALPVPPVMVREQLCVPAAAFDQYLGVPVEWDDADDRVLIQGPPGWGYYHVAPAPPVEVVRAIGGGPPPWAPAHGRRRKEGRYYATPYAPAPFVYSGVTYIPLRDATSLIGAALLWDSLSNQAVVTYNGREIGLAIGSPTVYYGGETIVLGAAPVFVRDVVYVPAEFCERYLSVPIRRSSGVIKLKGPRGWHDFRLASAPPGRVRFVKAKQTHYVAPREPGRVRSRPAQGWERGQKDRGEAKQRGKGHTFRIAGDERGRVKGGGAGKWKGGGEGRSKGNQRGQGKQKGGD